MLHFVWKVCSPNQPTKYVLWQQQNEVAVDGTTEFSKEREKNDQWRTVSTAQTHFSQTQEGRVDVKG